MANSLGPYSMASRVKYEASSQTEAKKEDLIKYEIIKKKKKTFLVDYAGLKWI